MPLKWRSSEVLSRGQRNAIGLTACVEFNSLRGEDGELPSFWRRDPMPIKISRGKFMTDAVKGMLADALSGGAYALCVLC
jgi:hypothetical protein